MPNRDPVQITPYRDGPLLVRGPASIVGPDGSAIDHHRRTVALCRCGKSKLRPFCDGTHKQIAFRADAGGPQAKARSTAATAAAPSG